MTLNNDIFVNIIRTAISRGFDGGWNTVHNDWGDVKEDIVKCIVEQILEIPDLLEKEAHANTILSEKTPMYDEEEINEARKMMNEVLKRLIYIKYYKEPPLYLEHDL